MEFGLHEEFPIYAGGLGILAGDFIKSAHDLRPARDRRRAALGARLLAPAHRRGRPAGLGVPDLPRRLPRGHRRPRARPGRDARGRGARLAHRALGQRAAPPARAGRHARRLDHATASTIRRSTAASRRRSCSASAACARCASSASTSTPTTSTRATRSFAGLELIAERMAAGATFADGVGGGARADRLHHPHAGRRRQRGARARRAAPARRLLRAGRRRDARRSAATRST